MLNSLSHDTDRSGLLNAMEGHIISSGNLVGLYQRQFALLYYKKPPFEQTGKFMGVLLLIAVEAEYSFIRTRF